MAKIVKTGKKYKVVSSSNGVTVRGGSNLTKKKAAKVKTKVLARNRCKSGCKYKPRKK